MSVTSVSYFTGSGQPSFYSAVSVGMPQQLTPPVGVTEFRGVAQKYWQVATAYSPPALDTVATYLNTTCYLTGDEGFTPVGGGVQEWTRFFHRIPSSHTDYLGSVVFSYPGRTALTSGSAITVSAVSAISSTQAIYTATGHSFSNGDYVYLALFYSSSPFSIYIARFASVTGVSGANFQAAILSTAGTFSSGKAYAGIPGANPKSRPGSSYVVCDYFLPGVSSGISAPTDIPINPVFSVTDQYGNESDDYTVTSTTQPSASQYAALVSSGSYLISDCVVERYAGNIFVRKTTFVRAQ